jgi:hypothetical protein
MGRSASAGQEADKERLARIIPASAPRVNERNPLLSDTTLFLSVQIPVEIVGHKKHVCGLAHAFARNMPFVLLCNR